MVCVKCVLIEQLVPARPPKSLNGDNLPLTETYSLSLVVLRGCFAAKKNLLKTRRIFLYGVEDDVCVLLLGLLVPGPAVAERVGRVLREEQANVVAWS